MLDLKQIINDIITFIKDFMAKLNYYLSFFGYEYGFEKENTEAEESTT